MFKLPGATNKFVHETIRIMNMCHLSETLNDLGA